MSVEVLVKNITMGTGEGPHWEESTQSLLFVDIVTQDVRRLNYSTGKVDEIKLGFAIPRKSEGLVVGLGKTVSHLDWDTRKVATLIEFYKNSETRMNVAKCDSRGRLWAGTMGIDRWPDLPHMGEGSLYCVDTYGTVKKCKDKTNISNGLAWSSDETAMFYIDSVPGTLWAYDYDIESGTTNFENLGSPDGMTIDTDGKVWVACYGACCVVRIDPNTGKLLQKIDFPAKRITSCCFGGPNYDELFVTSAGADESEMKQFPLAGSLFKVRGLGAKGYPPNVYQG